MSKQCANKMLWKWNSIITNESVVKRRWADSARVRKRERNEERERRCWTKKTRFKSTLAWLQLYNDMAHTHIYTQTNQFEHTCALTTGRIYKNSICSVTITSNDANRTTSLPRARVCVRAMCKQYFYPIHRQTACARCAQRSLTLTVCICSPFKYRGILHTICLCVNVYSSRFSYVCAITWCLCVCVSTWVIENILDFSESYSVS